MRPSSDDSLSTPLRWLRRGLAALGVVLVGYYAMSVYSAHAFNEEQKRRLDAMIERSEPRIGVAMDGFRDEVTPAATAPTPRVGADGLIGRIDIPSARISAVVMQGMDSGTLRKAVGHLPGTALPGHPDGNVVLAAHRDGLFSGLQDVEVGTPIELVTPWGSYDYVTTEVVVVDPEDTWALEPAAGRDLTLVTCYPFWWAGPAPRRFIVHARLADGTS